MPRSDRDKNRRQPVKGRKPSQKKKQPAVELPMEDIKAAVTAFKHGKTILYPSDTVYAIGCDATNYDAIEKIYELTKRPKKDGLIILVDSFNMLDQYIEEVPEMAWEVLKHNKKPLTIVYDRPKGMAENIIRPDNTIAIRVTNDPITRAIIKGLRKPIVSTCARFHDAPLALGFYDIDATIKDGVEYVLDIPLLNKHPKLSSILKLSGNGTMKILRK